MTTPTLTIRICMGSSCFSRGNNVTLETLKRYIDENSLDAAVTLSGSLCEGQCNTGPNVIVNDIKYEHVDHTSIIDIIKHHLKDEPFRCENGRIS